MRLFTKLFKQQDQTITDLQVPWIHLSNVDQLAEIEEHSILKTQLIFKHSTRCGISRMVKKQFENDFDQSLNIDLFYLDLLKFRDVSNEIESKFQISHESPQIIIIKNGNAVTHASHSDINNVELIRFIL